MDKDIDLLTMLALKPELETKENVEKVKINDAIIHNYFHENRPALQGKPHVVMVGGGIISLMTAFYLEEMGFRISIIEQKSFGAAASGRNGGAVMMMGRELIELPFARHSINLWEQLSTKGINTHFERKGHLMVARNDIEVERLTKAYELYKAAGIPVKLLNNEEMKSYTPHIGKENKLGLFSYEDAQSYPFTTIQSLIKQLKTKGVQFYPYTKATSFETNNRMIEGVITGNSVIKGDYYLISAGPWSLELGKLLDEHISVKARRSQLMVTEIVKKKAIVPFFTGNGFYSRQTHVGNLLFGGGGPWEINGYDVSNTSYAIELLSNRFTEVFPTYKTKQLIRSFAGTVEITPDHVPAFGKLLNWDNGFVSAGYNGHGYGLSAVMGKLMSLVLYDNATDRQLCNDIKSVIDPLKIDRFTELTKV